METKLAFDDVLLLPEHSQVLPSDVSLKTDVITPMAIPVFSAAMDTVTESRLSIAMARAGGIGVIHKNLTTDEQAGNVKKVKNAQWAFIKDPLTAGAQTTLDELQRQFTERNVGSAPVIDEHGRVTGIITKRDLRIGKEISQGKRVQDLMSAPAITAHEGASRNECLALLKKHRIEKLPIVNTDGKLVGLRTLKDLMTQWPQANMDSLGRLRVAGAVGVGDYQRMEKLVESGVDFLVIDSAHGYSQKIIDTVQEAKRYSIPLIAGNVATPEAARALFEAGAQAIKIGMGAGSICTTRVVTGVGVPQFSAIKDIAQVMGKTVPLIADGGIRTSGDIVKALAAGAHAVMLGSMLAGTEESPGETVHYQGRAYKYYRGMGSMPAMLAGSKDRYFQSGKMTPEGVEARVPFRGTVESVLQQLLGGLKSGMGYVGASTISELHARARFVRITNAGIVENAPHDVTVIAE